MNKCSAVAKLLPLWTVVNLIFSISVYAANAQTVEKPISLQIKDLNRWKNSPEALAIKQSIQALVKPRPDYPRIAEPFANAKRYQPLYRLPFLVLEAESGHFGGFFALIVFKGYPKVLSLWVYEIDKNVFEVREIEPLRVTLNKIIMNELEDERLAPLWVVVN